MWVNHDMVPTLADDYNLLVYLSVSTSSSWQMRKVGFKAYKAYKFIYLCCLWFLYVLKLARKCNSCISNLPSKLHSNCRDAALGGVEGGEGRGEASFFSSIFQVLPLVVPCCMCPGPTLGDKGTQQKWHLSLRISTLPQDLPQGQHPCLAPWPPCTCGLLRTGSLQAWDLVQGTDGCNGFLHQTVSELTMIPLSENHMREQSFCP